MSVTASPMLSRVSSSTPSTSTPLSQGGLVLPPLRFRENEGPSPSSATPSSASLGVQEHRTSAISTAATSPGGDSSHSASNSRQTAGGRSRGVPGSSTRVLGGLQPDEAESSKRRRRYQLGVIQNGHIGSDVGFGQVLGRLPILPATVVSLKVFEEDGLEVLADDLSSTLVCTCALLPSDGDIYSETLDNVSRAVAGEPGVVETRSALVGTLTSSLHRVPPMLGPAANTAYFVFSDVCVRVQGYFRLLITLFDPRPASAEGSRALARTVTAPFSVVPFEQYPGGIEAVPELSRYLHHRGIAIYAPPYHGITHLPP